jgi:molecular chaperone GrpE
MSDQPAHATPDQPTQTAPEQATFGLVDVIEAFTAMRHEFRTQSTEDRKLAEQLAAATGRIDQLEKKIQSSVDRNPQSLAVTSSNPADDLASGILRRLCESLAEIDHHLSRTVETAVQSLGQGDQADGQRDRAAEHFRQQIDHQLKRTGWCRRWFVLSWARQLQQSFAPLPESASATTSATVSALQMLRERVARLVCDAGIERIDVTGKPFDGSLMNAVDSVASDNYPGGHVVLQHSPAYRWRQTIVRYAEVSISSS